MLVDEALSECDRLLLVRTEAGDLWPVVEPTLINMPKLREVLSDPDASELLDICLGRLDANDWAARSLLARGVWKLLAPRPVANFSAGPATSRAMTVPGRRFSSRGPRRGISATRRNGLQNHHSMAQRNVVQTRLQTSAQSGGVTTMDFWTTLRVGIGELSSTSEKLQGCGPSYQRTPSRRPSGSNPLGPHLRDRMEDQVRLQNVPLDLRGVWRRRSPLRHCWVHTKAG